MIISILQVLQPIAFLVVCAAAASWWVNGHILIYP
jgi:hypothetical protein